MSVIKYKDPATGKWVPVGGIFSDDSGNDSIPDYVRNEAERVAKVVQSRQNANTITFLACSDIHYSLLASNTAQQIKSITHLGQAMKLIREKVHIDFAAMLGDMFWDGGETSEQALSAVRFVHSCLYDGFLGIPNFFARGNHDNGYNSGIMFSNNQIYANVGIYNTGAVYDGANRVAGYCYRDFEDQKLRVICLNSAEDSSGGSILTQAQVTWLANALAVPDGWNSMILSHHPLDWGKNGGANPANTLNAASGLIAAFHGHIHNFKVDTITGTEIKRITIPNACFGRENEYGTVSGINWGESTTYEKTADSAEDTSFCVVTINLDEQKIYADHYGAGYSRVISFGEEDVVTYTVTNTLTKVNTSNSETTVSHGAAYSATLSANSGYTLTGGTVKVTMGGTDITASAYSGGKITITNVTGDIVITASAVAEQTGPVNRVSTSIDTTKNVYNGKGYKEGYRLNSSGVEAEQADAVVSGFIPYNGEVIRVYGTTNASAGTSGNYIGMYDANFAKIYVLSGNNAVLYGGTWEAKNGKYMITVDPATCSNAATKDYLASAKYIRASMPNCTGANFVVTLDEEIK